MSLYRSCSSLSWGWSVVIFSICLLWRTVSGISTIRTISVNAMIAMPKFRNETLYSRTRLFIIGWMIARFHISMNICKNCMAGFRGYVSGSG